MSVRVRFAPSPTGFVHIGSLRTALYNYLFAEKNQGTYLLRIEDTDQGRLVEGAVEGMLEAMAWAGIRHGEGPCFQADGKTLTEKGAYGPYTQSQRLPLYKQYCDQLVADGYAYPCFCSKERIEAMRESQREEFGGSKYDGFCKHISPEDAKARIAAGEPHVIRLKMPKNQILSFEDSVRGLVEVNSDEVDDQVLMKQDGFPTYHMAVVVDDHLMGITHVIRGEEWLPSTPKHIYLYQALGWEAPRYVHLPNILNTEKKKLSKRQGDVSVADFQTRGYLPEALVNFIALVGWSPEDNREIMTLEEMKAAFSFERVSKSGGVFDVAKLKWMNNQYIRVKPLEELTAMCVPYLTAAGLLAEPPNAEALSWAAQVVDLSREYLDVLSEIPDFARRFVGEIVTVEPGEAAEILQGDTVPVVLEAFEQAISDLEVWEGDAIQGAIKTIQKTCGVKGKALFMPIRIAAFGQVHGPDLIKSLVLLGKENLLARVARVREAL